MKILDCTLRDGGYYTNWDFDSKLVDTYIKHCNNLHLEYLEIGYKSPQLEGYYGAYYYLPNFIIEEIKLKTSKKLAILINFKDFKTINLVAKILETCKKTISLVRVAVNPIDFKEAIVCANEIKKMGFEVAINLMYMSTWIDNNQLMKEIESLKNIDYLYMVDSYGGIKPNEVSAIIKKIKLVSDIKLGFHGHNNLELALANSIVAIENGVDIVDSTFTGMGRGAGNLKTELLLTYIQAVTKIDCDFNSLSKIVEEFTELKKEYNWGNNLPYMVSGAYSLPQKDVMDWVGKRYYSLNSIIRALQNQSLNQTDNIKLPLLKIDNEIFTNCLIVGGGTSVSKHIKGVMEFLSKNPTMPIIHASVKNSHFFKKVKNKQFYCLIGNEGYRLEETFQDFNSFAGIAVLPPFPRTMGTYLPEKLINVSYELDSITFTENFQEAHTSVALQVALIVQKGNIYIAGYDGYSKQNITEKEQDLMIENNYLFNKIVKAGRKLISLTPTKYSIVQQSIYEYL